MAPSEGLYWLNVVSVLQYDGGVFFTGNDLLTLPRWIGMRSCGPLALPEEISADLSFISLPVKLAVCSQSSPMNHSVLTIVESYQHPLNTKCHRKGTGRVRCQVTVKIKNVNPVGTWVQACD